MRRRSGPRVEVFMGFWQTIVMKKWHCNWSDVPMMLHSTSPMISPTLAAPSFSQSPSSSSGWS